MSHGAVILYDELSRAFFIFEIFIFPLLKIFTSFGYKIGPGLENFSKEMRLIVSNKKKIISYLFKF